MLFVWVLSSLGLRHTNVMPSLFKERGVLFLYLLSDHPMLDNQKEREVLVSSHAYFS